MLQLASPSSPYVCLLLTVATLLPSIGMPGRADEVVAVGAAQERKANAGQHEIAKLRKHLEQKTNLDKGIDASTPLKDALEFLADRYDFTVIVDTKAFDAIGVPKVDEQPVQLSRMVGVPLATVLSLLLRQIVGEFDNKEYHGTYFIRPGYVEISTTLHTFWAARMTGDLRRWLPTVKAEFDREPLEDALHMVSELSSTNVALDVRVGQKARTPVTARLHAVPVDTAVRLLADMADLKVVAIDNILYVTSKENAQAMEDEKKPRAK